MLKEDGQQILLFTQIRETGLFLATRYARMNVFVKTAPQDATDVEVRYMTVTSFPLKTFYSYQKDKFVNKVFRGIRSRLIIKSE